MRRRLVLLRHGESGWDGDPPSDHERVLTDEGRGEAERVGQRLVEEGWAPERVVCSTAARARQTCEIAAPEAPTSHHQPLYLGGLAALGELSGELPDELALLWAVGHNPAFSATASMLCGQSVSLSTAYAACLEIDAESWEEALDLVGTWSLVAVLTPAR